MKYQKDGSKLVCYYKLQRVGYIDLDSFNGIPIFYPDIDRALYSRAMLRIAIKLQDIEDEKRQTTTKHTKQ